MKNFKMLFVILFSMFVLIGCGGEEGVAVAGDDNVTSSEFTVNLVSSSAEVTVNEQEIKVEVRVINTDGSLYNNGNVKVVYPASFATGRDVGSFNTMSVAVNNGIAIFEYVAPADITVDISNIEFEFYHEDNINLKKKYTVTIKPILPNIEIILPMNEIEVTSNNQVFTVRVKVIDSDNTLFQTGAVKVKNPSYIRTRDIGTFNSSSASLVNGIASFTYTAPDSIDNNTSDIEFEFYHEDDPSKVKVFTVKINPSIPALTLFLPKLDSNITQTSQSVTIKVNVFDDNNNPYQNGKVNVIYPDDIKTGRDVGSFVDNSIELVNGVASFSYIGPSNIDQNSSNIVFGFYHEENPTKIGTYTIKIDNSQVVLTSYKLEVDYGDSVNMNLESSKQIYFNIKDINDNVLDDAKITSIKITSINTSLGILEDIFGNSGNVLTISNKNNVLVNIKSNTISGIMPLDVEGTFVDANGDTKVLTKKFNILILSGPPTAMSLAYVSSSQKPDIAKLTEKWILTVTDKYNNLVNTEPSVSMGMIAGFAKSSAAVVSNNQNYLFFPPNASGGTINSTNDTFLAQTAVFDNLDFANDVFVTFGDGYTYNASGKWDITKNTSIILNLVDNYEGNTTTQLGFAVGHNYRQDTCSNLGAEWVANIYPENGFIVDSKTGTISLEIAYDYYLIGKSAVLWVNLIGKQNSIGKQVKIGEARKMTFRGNGLEAEPTTYPIGYTGVIRVPIKIAGIPEWYKNANFAFSGVSAPANLSWEVVGTSMDANDVSSCANGGVAYVDINITSPAPAGGSISLINVLTSSEF